MRLDPLSYLYGIITAMAPVAVAVVLNMTKHQRRWNALADEERRHGERRRP